MKSHRLFVFSVFLSLRAALPAEPLTGLDPARNLQAVVDTRAEGFTFKPLEHGVQFAINGVTKNVLLYGPAIVRVNANLGVSHTKQPSLAIVARPAPVPFTVRESADALTLASSELQVVADKKTGALRFLDAAGTELTRERAEQPSEIKSVTISEAPTYEVRQTFTLSPDESLYGLGQYDRPYMDYRGQEVLLVQTNIGTVVPFMVSTRRYGILWDIYSKMIFKDDASGASLWAESAPAGVDYYFVRGGTMDEVIAGYRQLTGRAPMFPKAAFGLFMSKERYKTQDQLLEVVRRFRAEGFPLDYIVQDWQYWGGGVWGGEWDGYWSGMIWNKERFPDPAGMARTVHELHAKLMISIWPSVGNDTELARELDAHGLRFEPLHWISKKARIYDAFSPEGRVIYFKHIKKGLLDVGVDALWMDGTEVEVGGACHDPAEVERDIKKLGRNALGDFTRYLNPYSLVTTQGTYEGQRATTNKRVLTLTRSAWAGQQRYAAMPWSGDTKASWSTLRNQISGGINIAMAGLPYWTQDTGGFFVNYKGGEKNPEYQELFARWNQFAIFNPIYRIHGTNIEREPYVFKNIAPDVYGSLLGAARLRYQLLPYIYALAWQTTANNYTIMRGLPMDFPDDHAVRKIDDAFMFGPAFLAHPISWAILHRSDPPAATIPVEALKTPEGQPGLSVQYFEGVNFDKPAGKTIDLTVDHAWPGPPLANPPPGLSGFDNFSARWQGTITAPETGEYELGIEYDDGGRLFANGKLLVEDWSLGAKRYRGTRIALTKGQKLPIVAEFYQGSSDRYFRLCWRTPDALQALLEKRAEVSDAVVETYLPATAGWYDFWTNERFDGGRTVKKACPLDTFPLYVRAGSIVPMGPVLQYVTEQPDAQYQIRIYPGANAQFTVYEDDGETYNYEQGQRSTYILTWDDAAKTLHISGRDGSFPKMTATRKLEIVLPVYPKRTGTPASTVVRTVEYDGKPATVQF